MKMIDSESEKAAPTTKLDGTVEEPKTKPGAEKSKLGETLRKQLIVVVEGTAALGPFWLTILSDYLEKIVRCFCGNNAADEKHSKDLTELSLVMFSARGPYSACLVQRSGWTTNMDLFLQWLSALSFVGGGFSDAAIAEGLGEALMMFYSTPRNKNQNVQVQKHCVLVAASNPYPLPTVVYRPQPQNLENSAAVETQPDSPLYDAETLAKCFPQRDISLSIICPKQLPKLRGIYNAGKYNPQAADPAVYNVKNPQFLVLISENFMEALDSLNQTRVVPVKTDEIPVPSIPGPSPAPYLPGVSGSLPIPAGNTGMLQSMNNLQGSSATDQMHPGTTDGNVPVPQMVHTGMSMNQKIINTIASGGTMKSTPAMSHQGLSGMHPAAVNSGNPMMNTPLSEQPSPALQSPQSRHVKIWEGNLYGKKKDVPILITRLVGFRKRSSPESLAADWPPEMVIDRMVSQDHMQNKNYTGKAVCIIFQALNQHNFLGQMLERKLCAVVHLPTQTLMLALSSNAHHFIGLVLPALVPLNPLQQQQQEALQTHQQEMPQINQQPQKQSNDGD